MLTTVSAQLIYYVHKKQLAPINMCLISVEKCKLVNEAQCAVDNSSAVRCVDMCSANQNLAGDYPEYQSCSMYGMWDEAVKPTEYIYPTCSGRVIEFLCSNFK